MIYLVKMYLKWELYVILVNSRFMLLVVSYVTSEFHVMVVS